METPGNLISAINGEKRHLVWMAGVSWDGIAGTDRHMVTAMTRHARILWVDPPISPVTTASRRNGAGQTFKPRLSVVDDNVNRLTPVALPGLSRPVVRDTTSALVRSQVRWAIRRLNFQPFAVVASYLGDLLGYWGRGIVNVLYGTDDYVAGAELMGLSVGHLLKQELRALARADVVVAVSSELAQRWTNLGASPVVIPNGCRLASAMAQSVSRSVPDLPPPVVGLVGQISDRIDLDVLEAIAAHGFSLLLVGPVDPRLKRDRFNELTSKSNVHYVGAVSTNEVPSYLSAIDVGITPYMDTPFNRASFPLKTLEYLGAGLPVVSADLPAARWLHANLAQEEGATVADQIFALARNGVEYVEAIQRIVGRQTCSARAGVGNVTDHRDNAINDMCTGFAAKHTWSRRAETLASAIGLQAQNVAGPGCEG